MTLGVGVNPDVMGAASVGTSPGVEGDASVGAEADASVGAEADASLRAEADDSVGEEADDSVGAEEDDSVGANVGDSWVGPAVGVSADCSAGAPFSRGVRDGFASRMGAQLFSWLGSVTLFSPELFIKEAKLGRITL